MDNVSHFYMQKAKMMGREKIQTLLLELRAEIKSAQLDEDEVVLLHRFDQELHELLEAGKQQAGRNALFRNATELEVGFSIKHPVIMGYLREIMDALSKMGV